jgi:hypothetical protein
MFWYVLEKYEIIFVEEYEVKRQHRRPRRRWEDNIKMDLK